MIKKIKTIFLLLTAVAACYDAFSQYAIRGKVVDGQTREPLAFVNIIFNNNGLIGTSTDINGRFQFNSPVQIETFTCSYVGYKKKHIALDSTDFNKNWIIELLPSDIHLREIVVHAGENPANRIIRNVIENKQVNNPENISSFQYTSYNKVIYDFEFTDASDKDSLQDMMDNVFKGGHLFIMESVTERKFIQPDNNEEIITGVKVSGFRNPSFAPLATDIQPFSFYKDIIPIFDIKYLNPISNGSLSKYDFSIEDTLFQNRDTTFIISFQPQPGKNYEALTGLLYINSNKYAIQNVIAEPFTKGFIDVKIQQQYQFLENRQWFPEQLNFEIMIRSGSYDNIGVSANGTSFIDEVELDPNFDRKDLSLESIKMHESANDRDSVFWTNLRSEPLNEKELATYDVLDSLGEKYKFDAMLRIMEKVSLNKIPMKFIDIDLSNALVYNRFEGVRLGFGAYTNEKLFKHVSIGGFFGYGLKDHQWKYGGEVILNMDKEKELMLRGKYQNTLLETGRTGLNFFNQKQFDFRSFYASQMDRIVQNSISVGMRAFRYARFNVALNTTMVTPQYAYEFQLSDQVGITKYTYTDIAIRLRYAFKEKLISSMHQRISLGTKYPVLSLYYSKGIKDWFSSDFNYNKVEVRIEESFYNRNLGETKIRVDAGLIDSSVPYGLLFTGEGSYFRDLSILVKNYFQTITPYEFLSDRYVSMHFSHSFGSLLFHIKKFKPILTLYQNIGWGMLSDPEDHQQIEFKTKEKGLYESGLQIDNLIKFNYLNVAYLGFGAGAYYRYGPYAYSHATDNLAFKFSMIFSSK